MKRLSRPATGRSRRARRHRFQPSALGLAGVVAAIIGLVALAAISSPASAQGDGEDTNGDGVADDFDGDGFADDQDGDCIPDDFNGDGLPDGDISGLECAEGQGGSLPDQLGFQEIVYLLDYVYQQLPDTTEPGEEADGFPNIPRLIEGGEDVGPDWSALDSLLGEPGARDLLQLADDGTNQDLLEFEDINNVEFVNPVTGEIELVATPEALVQTLTQVARAGGDQGLIAGSGSALKGPCMGQAWSYDADGQPLDVAFDWNRELPPVKYGPDGDGELVQAFTADDPFVVHVDGAVIYTGVAGGLPDGTGPYEHDWFINMRFLGFAGTNLDAGGDPNTAYENRNTGAVNLAEDLPQPAKISGLLAINGQMEAPGTGNGAPGDQNAEQFLCVASGFVDLTGGIPVSAGGAALVTLATVGLLFNARPARTFGGV